MALLDSLLDSRACDWKDRVVAYQVLGELDLSPEERCRADQMLVHALTPRPADNTLLPRIGRAVLSALALNTLVGLPLSFRLATGLTHAERILPTECAILCMAIIGLTPLTVPLCLVFLWMWDTQRNNRVHRAALTALIHKGDPADILSLYSHLHSHAALRPEMLQAFRVALPLLDDSRYGRLSPETLRVLEDISLAPEEDLALRALNALQRVGDASNIETIEQIARDSDLSQYRRELARLALERILHRQLHASVPPHQPSLTDRSASEPTPEQSPPIELEADRWERKLAAHSPIRAWLNRRRTHCEGSSAEALLRAMENPNAAGWADRVVAYQALRQIVLTPTERRHAARLLVQALTPAEKRATLPARFGTAVIQALILSCSVMLLLEFNLGVRNDALLACLLGIPVLTTLATPLFFAGLTVRDGKRTKSVQAAALKTLSQLGDPEAIAPLVWAAHRPALRPEALEALRKILPTVDASWYGRLPTAAGPALIALVEWEEEPLALATLDALAAAGSGSCAEKIERLVTQGIHRESVRRRALAVLPILTVRREQEMAAASLLRPSDGGAATDHLVRPVYGTEPEVANLLRASQADAPNASDQ